MIEIIELFCSWVIIGIRIYDKEEDIMREKVEEVLEKVRPMLQRDGGDVELVDVQDDGVVKVRLTGACSGCPMSTMTLKNAIEETIKKEVPGIKSVEQVQ